MAGTSGLAVWKKLNEQVISKIRWGHAIIGALVLGICLRLLHYGLARMLWLDESNIILNVITRDVAELFTPLDFEQIAPMGWLLIVNWLTTISQSYELSTRLPSLVAGLLSLFLFFRLAKLEFSKPVAFVAVLAFSLSFMPVYYSAEAKPYALDLLLLVLLTSIALRMFKHEHEHEQVPTTTIALLSLSFLFGAIFTLSAPVLVGGIGGVLILKYLLMKRYSTAGFVTIAASVSGLIFLTLSMAVYRTQVDASGFESGGMGNYFDRHYAPFPPTSLGDLMWYPKIADYVSTALFGTKSALVYLFLGATGILVCLRKQFWVFAILVSPLIAAFLLSAMKIYPMVPRLLIYFVPIMILLACYALEAVVKLTPKLTVSVVAIGVIFLNVGSLSIFWYEKTFTPALGDRDVSTEIATISQSFQEGDVIVVTGWSLPNFLLYRHQYELEIKPWMYVDSALCLTPQRLETLGKERAWLFKPFRAWEVLDRSIQTKLAPGDKAIVYNIDQLQEGIAWMNELNLIRQPSDPPNCDRQRNVTPYLRGGVAPIG